MEAQLVELNAVIWGRERQNADIWSSELFSEQPNLELFDCYETKWDRLKKYLIQGIWKECINSLTSFNYAWELLHGCSGQTTCWH